MTPIKKKNPNKTIRLLIMSNAPNLYKNIMRTLINPKQKAARKVLKLINLKIYKLV